MRLAAAVRRRDMVEVAEMLWSRPADPELLAAVDALAGQVDVDAAMPLQLSMTAESSALRARLLAAQGNTEEAIWLLLQASPSAAGLCWVRNWLSTSPDVFAHLDVNTLLAVVGDLQPQADQETALWSAVADILLLLCTAHSDQHGLLPALVNALGRAARHQEASRYAAQAYGQEPGIVTASVLARTLRRAGDVVSATQAYDLAWQHATDQTAPLREAGDMLMDAGRHAEALARYETLLSATPGHPRAAASASYLRYRLGHQDSRAELLRTWIAHPQHPRCRRLARETTPGIGYLLPPWEALVQFARGLSLAQLERMRHQARLQRTPGDADGPLCCRVVLERPEAPSAQQIIHVALRGTGLSVSIDTEEVPTPDPRTPRAADLRWQMWSYDANRARPCLPPPASPALARIISTLAGHGESLDDVARAGAWLGRRVASSVIEPLLATMLHPPPPPAPDTDSARWCKQVQRVCAAAIASIGPDWDGSPRRAALRSLIFGPSDWTVSAGAWAAVILAETDGTGAAETLDWILARLREEPIDVFCGQSYPLTLAAFFHPLMSTQGREHLLPLILKAEALLLV